MLLVEQSRLVELSSRKRVKRLFKHAGDVEAEWRTTKPAFGILKRFMLHFCSKKKQKSKKKKKCFSTCAALQEHSVNTLLLHFRPD